MTGLHLKRRLKNLIRRQQLAGRRELKLHLGCGWEYLPGYVNLDADPAARSDLWMDFRGLAKAFAPGSVTEVLMIHSLSYLNLAQARELFADLHRLLAPGGRLIIELPDIANCARKLLASEDDFANYVEGVRGFYAFGLEQLKNREHYTPYAFGWTGWHLQQELENHGYRDVKLLPPQTHERWRDLRAEAVRP